MTALTNYKLAAKLKVRTQARLVEMIQARALKAKSLPITVRGRTALKAIKVSEGVPMEEGQGHKKEC